jgi:hypothetical protein
MKKLTTILLLSILSGYAYSQCTPNPVYANSPAGFYPAQLPAANTGQAYTAQLDIKTQTDTAILFNTLLVNLKVKGMKIIDVIGEPNGFVVLPTYNDVNGYWLNAGSDPNWTPILGCTQFSAQPAAVQAAVGGGPNNDGVYPLTIVVDALAKGNPIPSTYSWLSSIGQPPYGYAMQITGYSIVVNNTNTCTYNFQASNTSFNAAGGSATFSPNTQANCTWTVTTNNPQMITGLPAGTQTGNTPATFNVLPCVGNNRSATITATNNIGGQQVVTINQTCNQCFTAFNISSDIYPAFGGTGTITSIATDSCMWVLSTNNPQLISFDDDTLYGNTQGAYIVSTCPGNTDRTGNIFVKDENGTLLHTFPLNQDCSPGQPCTYNFQVSQVAFDCTAGIGTITPNTLDTCQWDVTITDNNGMIIMPTGPFTGNTPVTFTVTPYQGLYRECIFNIWTEGIGTGLQPVISQTCAISNCTYSFSIDETDFGITGGTPTISTNTIDNCPYMITTDNPSMIAGLPQDSLLGDQDYWVVVAACLNFNDNATGHLTVAGATGSPVTYTITRNCLVGINEYEKPKISIQPNPAKDILSINISNIYTKKINLSIVDYTGRIISRENISFNGSYAHTLDLSATNLKPGVYFIRLDDGTVPAVAKFVYQPE